MCLEGKLGWEWDAYDQGPYFTHLSHTDHLRRVPQSRFSKDVSFPAPTSRSLALRKAVPPLPRPRPPSSPRPPSLILAKGGLFPAVPINSPVKKRSSRVCGPRQGPAPTSGPRGLRVSDRAHARGSSLRGPGVWSSSSSAGTPPRPLREGAQGGDLDPGPGEEDERAWAWGAQRCPPAR